MRRIKLLVALIALGGLVTLSGGGAANAGPPSPPNPPDDALIAPPYEPEGPPEAPPVGDAPDVGQPSEFMAGTIVYSVVFVESNGGAGNCAPADAQTETWTPQRQSQVTDKIRAAEFFWENRPDSPPVVFVEDTLASLVTPRTTSCEPINRSHLDQGLWIADVLTGLGTPATPGNYFNKARDFIHARRAEVRGTQ